MAKRSQPRTSRSKHRGSPERAENPNGTTQVLWSPPAGVPLAGAPDANGVEVFEKAVQALQRHNYASALSQFRTLMEQFPGERALLDRARVYATLCERELAGAEAEAPATIEERLTAATAALNNRQDRQAELLVNQVLAESPNHELAHYLLAVVHARRGATAAALDALQRAVALSPEVLAQARHDTDFEALRDDEQFQQMMSGIAARSGTDSGSKPFAE